VGMIHSIAHDFKEFGIQQGTVGLEFTFLTQAMMGCSRIRTPSRRRYRSRIARISCRNCVS
jgi:hypothetical protein